MINISVPAFPRVNRNVLLQLPEFQENLPLCFRTLPRYGRAPSVYQSLANNFRFMSRGSGFSLCGFVEPRFKLYKLLRASTGYFECVRLESVGQEQALGIRSFATQASRGLPFYEIYGSL